LHQSDGHEFVLDLLAYDLGLYERVVCAALVVSDIAAALRLPAVVAQLADLRVGAVEPFVERAGY